MGAFRTYVTPGATFSTVNPKQAYLQALADYRQAVENSRATYEAWCEATISESQALKDLDAARARYDATLESAAG